MSKRIRKGDSVVVITPDDAVTTPRKVIQILDGGKKVVSGGYSSDAAIGFDSRPISDTAWSLYLLNPGDAATNVTLYAVCIG